MENILGEGSPSEGLTTGAIFIATSLYGLFFILFALSSFVLHSQILTNKKKSSGPIGTSVYLTLGYTLFFIVSLSWVTLWIVSMHPSLGHGDGNRYGVFLYIQSFAEASAVVVADWILLYRLYIIWNKERIILIVITTAVILQTVVVICDSVYYARQRTSWAAGIFILFISTLLTYTGATALITWKLWSTNRHVQDIGGQKIRGRVIRIIVESAAMSTIYKMVYFILFLTSRNTSYYLFHCLPYIEGITATLINVRVGFGWAVGERGRSTWSLHDHWN